MFEDYRYRDQAKDGINIAAWVIWGVIITAIITLGWLFVVKPLIVNKNAEILQDSYGAQQAKIAGARQSVVAFNTTDDEGQKKALANNACALITDINDKPQDLAAFFAKEC